MKTLLGFILVASMFLSPFYPLSQIPGISATAQTSMGERGRGPLQRALYQSPEETPNIELTPTPVMVEETPTPSIEPSPTYKNIFPIVESTPTPAEILSTVPGELVLSIDNDYYKPGELIFINWQLRRLDVSAPRINWQMRFTLPNTWEPEDLDVSSFDSKTGQWVFPINALAGTIAVSTTITSGDETIDAVLTDGEDALLNAALFLKGKHAEKVDGNGGVVEGRIGGSKVKVEIPKGVLLEATEFSIQTPQSFPDSLPPYGKEPFELLAIRTKDGKSLHKFAGWIDIEVEMDVEEMDHDLSVLSLFFFDELQGKWIALPTTLDSEAGAIRAQTDHFSVFAVGIESGYEHTCAVTNSGGVKCWGNNTIGQLGDGTTTPRATPVDVFGLTSDVAAVATGYEHTCALTSTGGVKCWGNNEYNSLGDGTLKNRLTPVQVVGLSSGVTAITAGHYHTCALTSGGGVKCWGGNANGQLGDSTTSQRQTPVDVVGLSSGVTSILAGYDHTCAITSGGGLKCWGSNGFNQLGDGTSTMRTTPVDVTGLMSGVIAVTSRYLHTCALTTSGGVKCWGYNEYGQLGDGTTIKQDTPVDVIGLSSGITAIAAGYYHTCAINSNGGVLCWGDNEYGELGDGTTIERWTPDAVVNLSNATAITAGHFHTCVITTSGGMKCWGNNNFGQLGDGTSSLRLNPVDVSGLSNGAAAISTGIFHTCALTSSGGVKCWGYNQYGQLGNNTTASQATPVDVNGLTSGVIAVSTGHYHSCALTSSGGVKCWGRNSYGQLGDNTLTQRLTPVDVVGLSSDVIAIVTGDYHTCALTSSGGVKCWGRNHYGRLGDGTTTTRHTPVIVTGLLSGVIAITAGSLHTCALTSSGGVKCWGYGGYGELGYGSSNQQVTPVDVFGLSSGVAAITAGAVHTCALMSSGQMKCWGSNAIGQLGEDSTVLMRLTPVDVSGLDNDITIISAGDYHTCAVTSNSNMKCWGYNNSGQLGDGSTADRLAPVDVIGLSGANAGVSAGYYHTCILSDTGGLKCWGDDGYGQIGDGAVNLQLTPVDVVWDGGSSLSMPELAWSAEANQSAAFFGESVRSAGDIDHDGFLDLVVGSPNYLGTGGVFVFYGTDTGFAATPDLILEGDAAGDLFGWSVAAAGDVNGDLYEDVIVGAVGCTVSIQNEGCAYLYHGSASGLLTAPSWSVHGNQSRSGFGYVVGGGGDIDGNGYADLYVGVPSYDGQYVDAGAVFVYFNEATGIGETADWIGLGDQENALFGMAVQPAMDLNGDILADLIIGAPNYTSDLPNEGKVYLYLGSSSGLDSTASWSVEGNQGEAHFGEAIGAGDINGDSLTDVIVGAPDYDNAETDEGAVFVYFNSVNGPSGQPNWSAESDQAYANFGISLDFVSNIDEDNIHGLLIGASRFDVTGENEGRVYLFYTDGSGLDPERRVTLDGDQSFAEMGYSVSAAGDVNEDGLGDFIVALIQFDHPEIDEGLVRLYYNQMQ